MNVILRYCWSQKENLPLSSSVYFHHHTTLDPVSSSYLLIECVQNHLTTSWSPSWPSLFPTILRATYVNCLVEPVCELLLCCVYQRTVAAHVSSVRQSCSIWRLCSRTTSPLWRLRRCWRKSATFCQSLWRRRWDSLCHLNCMKLAMANYCWLLGMFWDKLFENYIIAEDQRIQVKLWWYIITEIGIDVKVYCLRWDSWQCPFTVLRPMDVAFHYLEPAAS